MHEPGFRADIFGKVGQEGDDVVLGLGFDRINTRHIELSTLPDRLGSFLRDNTEFGLCITGMGFNLEPDTEFVLGLPNGSHFGTGIAWDHGISSSGNVKGVQAGNRPVLKVTR